MADWQSGFLPQAVTCLPHALSTQEPQSVLPNVGGGGGGGVVSAGGAVLAAAAGAAEAVSSAAAELAAGASELELSELCSAALSAGFCSPPPQASQSGGARTVARREATRKRWGRVMV